MFYDLCVASYFSIQIMQILSEMHKSSCYCF